MQQLAQDPYLLQVRRFEQEFLAARAGKGNPSNAPIFVVGLPRSGSTLIACEKTGRQARLIELDPKYCDVIVGRFQDYSGKAAVLESDGRSFDGVTEDRGFGERREASANVFPGS